MGPQGAFRATTLATAMPTSEEFVGVEDKPFRILWAKYSGPGDVTFSEDRPSVPADGKVSTEATFSAPGEYIIRVQVNDRSGEGGGGFQCCWTNTHVKVTVTGGTK